MIEYALWFVALAAGVAFLFRFIRPPSEACSDAAKSTADAVGAASSDDTKL